MPEKDWEKKLKAETVEVHSDPILDKGSGHDRMLRQLEVAYQGNENTTEQEVIAYFTPTIKQMAVEDGWTIADEDVEFPIKAMRIPGSVFGWRIVVLMRRSKMSNKDAYFGIKPGHQGVRRSRFAAKGIRSGKPTDLGELFTKPPVPPA